MAVSRPKEVLIFKIESGHAIEPSSTTQQFPIILVAFTSLEHILTHGMPFIMFLFCMFHIILITDTSNGLFIIDKEVVFGMHLIQGELVLVPLL